MTKVSHSSPNNESTQPEKAQEPVTQSNSVPQLTSSSSLVSPNLPKSAQTISIILNSFGISDAQPNVIYQLQEFAHRYTCDVLQDAQIFSDHCGKSLVDNEDVTEAINARIHHSFAPPPAQDFLDELAQNVNSIPLPPIQEKFGVRLPPEKYCLTAVNFQILPDSSAIGSRHNTSSKSPRISQPELLEEDDPKNQRSNPNTKAVLGGGNGFNSSLSKEAGLKRSDSADSDPNSKASNKLAEDADEDEDLDFEEVDDTVKPSD